MTSRDALFCLITNQKEVRDGFKFVNLKTLKTATVEDCYDTIMRDLEVLEILKRHSTKLDDADWNSNIFNGIDYEYLDEEERKVIKEWLENDN